MNISIKVPYTSEHNTLAQDIEALGQCRDGIAEVDEEILKLLDLRMKFGKVVGDIKHRNGKPIYAPEVEAKKIEHLSSLTTNAGMVEAIWPVIMCYTRTLE